MSRLEANARAVVDAWNASAPGQLALWRDWPALASALARMAQGGVPGTAPTASEIAEIGERNRVSPWSLPPAMREMRERLLRDGRHGDGRHIG